MLVSDYLFNVLNEKTDPSILIKWILGDLSEETFPEIRRSDFALYFLNYLQEQTSSVIESSSNNKKEDGEYKQSNENKSNSDYKHGVSRRQTPGHVRRIFPSPGEKSAAHSVKRTVTGQQSCETLPYNLQQRSSVPSPFSGPGAHSTGYAVSAPMLYDPHLGYNVPYYNNYNRSYNNYQPLPQSNLFATGSSTNLTNHFLNENSPLCNTNVSPNFLNLSTHMYNANYPSLMQPVADSPIKADQPDFSLQVNKTSPQSPQSSGKKHFQTPKTPKSNRIEQKSTPNSGSSCSSSISVMSPESPMYSENFPAMMSASERRTRRENSRASTDSGDSQSKKHSHNKKRIKPTQLSKTTGNSPMQDNFGKEIKTESKLFQQVPETFPERKQNFFQKEELTKQENTNNIATCLKVTNSESEIDSGDKKLCDKICMETEITSSPLEIENTDNKKIQTKSCNKNIKSGVKLNLCTPDISKVNYKCYLNRLAEIYSALLDANLVPNITAELYFIFSLLTVNINKSQTKSNTAKTNVNTNETCINDMSDGIQVMELSSPDDDESQSGLKNVNNPTPANSSGNDQILSEKSNLEATSKADVNLQLFDSIHQCVYFACAVISRQEHFLEILDKATLKLLIDNKRLLTFIPEVAQSLTRLYFKKDTELKTKQNYQLTPDEITINPVPFQMEIDNKDTFASESSFHMFRKQRDGFYEILQTWNEKHFRPDWNFNLLTPKIEKLFQMSDDPVNMRHLARHFCDLILKSVTQMDTGTDEYSVSGMPEIDRSKLNRLTERLTGPPLSGQKDPRPSPGFPGLQAFYHDFLVIPAANYSFHTHVINCIAGRIHALNETSFQLEEPDINGQVVQQETRFAFLQCLRSLCVLAKFLGLLVFGPYRCSKDLPQSVLQDEIITRSKILPPLDFQKYLTTAEEEGKLVQTVPWVVEYLGMMDSAAPYLKTYQTVLSTLFSIYLFTSPRLNSVITNGSSSNECSINSSAVRISVNSSNENIETKSDTSLLGRKSKFSMQTAVLLRLSIGWLFDTSNFSQSLFYNMASVYKENKEKERSEEKWHNVMTVDCSNIVDEKVLHDCCPYLNNLRVRLIESTNLKQGAIRHVTPVPSNHLSSTSEALASQTLELQLEENFFMGQSESLRKTVDFVAERVASACIKHICSNVIVSLKNKVYKLKVNKQQVDLQQYIDSYNESVKKEIENGINQRLNIALTALIGPDVVDQSVNVMCRQIAARKLQERVINWLQTHICISEILNKLPTDTNTQHDPHSYVQIADGKASEDLYTTSEALIFMQDLLNDVLDTRGTGGIITSAEFVVTMEQLSASFPLFGDNASNIKLLFSLVLDYMLQCITFRPAIVTEDVMDAFCKLWKLWNYSGPLNRILSQRNIIMLVQGGSAKVWDKFGEFIVFTLTHDVLTITDLESQAVGFFHYTWPEEILQAMSKCIRGIVENVQKHSSCVNDPKFVLMLEFCSEIATYVNDELEELY